MSIENYVDIENGVMYQLDFNGRLQLLYAPEGKPKIYPKLEKLQENFEDVYGVDVKNTYD